MRSPLGRRDHAVGERSLRHAAASGAGIDGALVLRDLDQPLGQVEHLTRLHPGLHRSRERRPAAPARRSLVSDDPVGRRRPPQRVALVAPLSPARLARTAAKAAGKARLLPQPVARRRLGARRAVQIQPAPKLGVLGSKALVLPPQIGDLRAKRGNLAPERFDQRLNFGRENHPHLDLRFAPARLENLAKPQRSHTPCDNSDSPGLGVTFFIRIACNPLRSLVSEK